MNYHLMVDEKFIDYIIDDAELCAPGNNVYLIKGHREHSVYVKHPKITFVEDLGAYLDRLRKDLKKEDKVFINWLNISSCKFILSIPTDIKVGLFFWGGDIVERPKFFYRKQNYDKLSLKHYNKFCKYPPHKSSHFNLLHLCILLKRRLVFWPGIIRELWLKKKSLERIDYFLDLNPNVYDVVKKIAPKFKADFFYHFIGNGIIDAIPKYELAVDFGLDEIIIWVGNSASISNNHLDAFKVLERFKDRKVKIICPLSYGDKNYAHFIAERGKSIFGDKFVPLLKYIPIKEYYELFQKVSIAVMYHNRPQALGNILGFLKMGKKVLMKHNNVSYKLFKEKGINIFSTDLLDDCTIEEITNPLSTSEIDHNISILRTEIINVEAKMKSLKFVLS